MIVARAAGLVHGDNAAVEDVQRPRDVARGAVAVEADFKCVGGAGRIADAERRADARDGEIAGDSSTRPADAHEQLDRGEAGGLVIDRQRRAAGGCPTATTADREVARGRTDLR